MKGTRKQTLWRRAASLLCAIMLCAGLLQSTAEAATVVVLDLADTVDAASASVVEVFTETKQVSSWFQEYVTEGAGSGVVLSADGYLVTNHHVIEGASAVKVRLNGETYAAQVKGADEKTDLAVLKIEASGLTPAKLADSSTVRAGDFVIAIGNPLGELGGTVTEGIISAKDRELTIDGQTMTLLQTSAAVNPGNSGGGLFNLAGELVGVVNAKSSGDSVEGLGFAIPANTVRAVTGELIQYGYVTGRPQLGIQVTQVTAMAAAYRGASPGVYIAQAARDSGLRAGDRLLRIDGTDIGSTADIQTVLDRHSVGDTVRVSVFRDGREAQVQVKLTERKPS